MKNRLRVLRAEHEFSQAELAEKLGVSRQTIHAIENDKYDPSLSLALKSAACSINLWRRYLNMNKKTRVNHY